MQERSFLPALASRPLCWVLAALALGGLLVVFARKRERDLSAFLGSCAFLAGLSAATAACVFPNMLRTVGGEGLSLTAYNGGGDAAGLRTALGWFSIGFPLAIFYFVTVFRLHRGKAHPAPEGTEPAH